MLIAVDARTVFSANRRGTGKNLIDLYSTLAVMRRDWEYVMFHQVDEGGDPFAGLPNVRCKRIDMPGDRWNFWQDLRLPLAARAMGASVLHCPANVAPRFSPTPVVLTIHDLIPVEIAPESWNAQRWLRVVRRSARKAERVITPSDYSRHAILRRTAIPDSKITVMPWAPDRSTRRVRDTAQIATIRRKYEVPENLRYLLAFGAADPRKNTAGIIEAWHELRRDLRQEAVLLIVGLQPTALDHYRALASCRIGDGSCLLHGFAAEEDMPALISGATALCYPSRSEGFGLPVLDAFVCGTPVITSASTSLPEVAGEAALLVDPEQPRAIADALESILSSDDLRLRLRAAGLRRVELFSWERCARTAAEVLEVAAVRSSAEA